MTPEMEKKLLRKIDLNLMPVRTLPTTRTKHILIEPYSCSA